MTLKVNISRTVTIPDRVRLSRFARAPELGPRILFFSGGSALNSLSRKIIDYTHNSIHLITPFDSGGSSAKLRQAFDMPAVGDLRNRLMALSDQSVKGNPAVVRLFSYRFPKDFGPKALFQLLGNMVEGDDEMVAAIPDPLRKIIRTHLNFFRSAMPEDFDLRGASIGNLVLAGGYLNNDHHLDPVVYLFGKLAEVRGVVRPVINQNLHLAADLEDGTRIVGQHLLTGREVPPIESPVANLFLTNNSGNTSPVKPLIQQKTRDLISAAELICYPMGSFYSSLVANLLPDGVTETVAQSDCPKVFVPNSGPDKECPNATVEEMTRTLRQYLMNGSDIEPKQILNMVILDSRNGVYTHRPDLKVLEAMGITVIDTELVTSQSHPYYDPERLLGVLLSLV
jgi:CofD-related protein of GAK system